MYKLKICLHSSCNRGNNTPDDHESYVKKDSSLNLLDPSKAMHVKITYYTSAASVQMLFVP